MAKLSAVVLAIIALGATNALAAPRHYALREVDLHAGPASKAVVSSVTVTTGSAHPTGDAQHKGKFHPGNKRPHNGTVNGTHHNGTHHNGTHHNGTHHGPHHNGTHAPQHNGTVPTRIGLAVSATANPSASSAAPSATGMMQVDGDTFAPNAKLNVNDKNESDTANHTQSNKTMNLNNSNGKGVAQVDNDTSIPAGAQMSTTDNEEGDNAAHSESSQSIQVN